MFLPFGRRLLRHDQRQYDDHGSAPSVRARPARRLLSDRLDRTAAVRLDATSSTVPSLITTPSAVRASAAAASAVSAWTANSLASSRPVAVSMWPASQARSADFLLGLLIPGQQPAQEPRRATTITTKNPTTTATNQASAKSVNRPASRPDRARSASRPAQERNDDRDWTTGRDWSCEASRAWREPQHD